MLNAPRKAIARTTGLLAAATACLLLSSSALRADDEEGYRILWDNFKDGFAVSAVPGPDVKWLYFGFPQADGGFFLGDDGVESTSQNGPDKGLTVRSPGVNPSTGDPAFTKTVGLEGSADNPGVPGGLDHVKWLVYMNHFASSGQPGFDAVPGEELIYEARVGGQSFGVDGNPFGPLVDNPDDDLRLGAVAMNAIDLETFMVFDFFLTNERIYAFYERLPFGRPFLGNYAAFSFQIPVATREPGDIHRLRIAYDRSAGVVRWLIGGREVFRVDAIGQLIDRQYLTIDHGGVEPAVPLELNQLWGGMGMFTLLDGDLPSDSALVRLSDEPDFYFDPEFGEPEPQVFADDASLPGNRLFGQGAEIRIENYVVSSRPSE
jgi:hypothetical protein